MAEFPTDAVWMLPDRFSQQELVAALDTLRHDGERRAALGRAAFALMGTRNSPQRCGWLYRQALERDLASQRSGRRALLQALLAVPGLALDEAGLRQLSRCAARAPDPLQQRQLLVDVTAIARHDLKTGIERVVRHQLLELLQLPHDSGWRAEAVYLSEEGGVPHFRYARRYVAGLLGIGNVLQGEDPPLDIQAGDAFYSADHEQRATMAAARAGIFADWRARGLSVNFLVHDLLPVLRPEFFPPHADITHDAWLRCVAGEADRLICVSRAVADELDAWLRQEQVARRPSLALEVLHHGADLGPAPQQLQPQQDSELLRQVAARPSFLMVGTIEPRKGHLQALDAFEQLWADGVDVNLVIVGSEGWKPLAEHERRTIPRIMQRLRKHPQLGQRLLHPAGVDDATLQQIYLASACLLSPSEGEGFGLPLIEAASYGLPLLLRDIPVFREVAGERAAYFSGSTGQDLAAAVRQWLAQHGAGSHPQPHGMPSRSWRDNVAQLLSLLEQPLHRAAPARPPQRQLLVDVTNIARHDLKTGIERVVRHQLLELLQLPPDSGWRAEAVYLSEEGGVPHYRYAHRYVAALLGAGEVRQGEDPPLEVLAGDAYYCADHSPHTAMTAARAGIFAGWRARGISLSFVVYDLLPVLRPDFFPAGADATHADWLRCLAAEADRLVCISQAVADELRGWLEREQAACRPGLEITASHLGADIGAPPQQLEQQQQDSDLLRQIAARPSFLMVATIEPRKGHLQTLDAFEQLWAEGVDVNLVLVGKEGWQPLAEHERRTIPQIMARLQQHPELGKRLLRPSAVDDATLQQIYLASSCLLSPSEGEGFGLPLIEAASYGLPLLLRDIPVFREVAGERAAYFSGTTGQDLAAAVRQWLAQHGAGRHPQPQGMPWRTWRDNVAHLLSLLEQPKEQPC